MWKKSGKLFPSIIVSTNIMTDRKKDHIALAFNARTGLSEIDRRFYYEPLMAKHPAAEKAPFSFLGKTLRAPIWVSSMTGGTKLAGQINRNLAMVCREFGLGMGLGSCRPILDSDDHFADFDMREIIGHDLPFYANLGIAQLEKLVLDDDISLVDRLIERLRADGLIIHVNPLQEWLQPEGDLFSQPPIDTIRSFLEMTSHPVIVKEVGQGMGPESLRALLALPLEAVELAAFGGTNFAKLELMRSEEFKQQYFGPVSLIGHDAFEMTGMINEIVEGNNPVKCRQIIISGGISSFLDGYYLVSRCKLPAIYGQASGFLKYATQSYEELEKFVKYQVEGIKLASAYFVIKDTGR
jgi:isopentenyl-diphosphate delta-isomerase